MVGGTQSNLEQSRMQELVRRMPNASFRAIDRDHCIHVERPSEFLKMLEPFISWFAK